MKSLVVYFSATGATAKLAETLSGAAGADIFEIRPEIPYTKDSLNWQDKHSRSSVEMRDPSARPAIAGRKLNLIEYNIIYIGFPIWWYEAPRIISTFLESYDFSGKTLIPFATSGGSGIGDTTEKLQKICPAANWKPGRVWKISSTEPELIAWIDTLNL